MSKSHAEMSRSGAGGIITGRAAIGCYERFITRGKECLLRRANLNKFK